MREFERVREIVADTKKLAEVKVEKDEAMKIARSLNKAPENA